MQFTDPKIEALFNDFPEPAQSGLRQLRGLIFEEAVQLPEIGRLEEVLRWGQPSYITPEKKAATTLRLGLHKDAGFALYAHCQSNIISNHAARFPAWDRLDGNRAVLFDDPSQIDPFRLRALIKDALTYHLR